MPFRESWEGANHETLKVDELNMLTETFLGGISGTKDNNVFRLMRTIHLKHVCMLTIIHGLLLLVDLLKKFLNCEVAKIQITTYLLQMWLQTFL